MGLGQTERATAWRGGDACLRLYLCVHISDRVCMELERILFTRIKQTPK